MSANEMPKKLARFAMSDDDQSVRRFTLRLRPLCAIPSASARSSWFTDLAAISTRTFLVMVSCSSLAEAEFASDEIFMVLIV